MKKPENKNTKKTNLNWIEDTFAVSGVKVYSDSCCFFNLYVKSAVGNIAIYGCKVVTTKDGNDFIAFPSESYEVDGKTKYRDYASIIFNADMSAKIINEVAKLVYNLK